MKYSLILSSDAVYLRDYSCFHVIQAVSPLCLLGPVYVPAAAFSLLSFYYFFILVLSGFHKYILFTFTALSQRLPDHLFLSTHLCVFSFKMSSLNCTTHVVSDLLPYSETRLTHLSPYHERPALY